MSKIGSFEKTLIRNRIRKTKTSLKKLPSGPGIYLFWDKKSKPLYVGKAINLQKRVSSYFSINLLTKTKKMVQLSTHISYIEVTSELESLLLEAEIIHRLQPKFNVDLKDDKGPIYIVITKEKYPQVKTARKNQLEKKNFAIGPFPATNKAKFVLKIIRKVVPYGDHKIGKRACFYSHLNLCSPCPSVIESQVQTKKREELRRIYLKNIRKTKSILKGNFASVRNMLSAEMRQMAKQERYEEANTIKERLEKLDYITQHITPIENFVKNPNFIRDIRDNEISALSEILTETTKTFLNISRIECFDVAHLAGTNPTASMVTFVNGEPDKSYYRHFKIRQKRGGDDVASLKEVATRRAKYFPSWGIPQLIIVDGGKGQTRAFSQSLNNKDILVVGLAKRNETLIIPIFSSDPLRYDRVNLSRGPAKNLVQRMRNEAHRFARRYHHKLVEKQLLSKS